MPGKIFNKDLRLRRPGNHDRHNMIMWSFDHMIISNEEHRQSDSDTNDLNLHLKITISLISILSLAILFGSLLDYDDINDIDYEGY